MGVEVSRKNYLIFLSLIQIFFLFLIPEYYSPEQEELHEILKKCADYCENLANLSLNFICKEIIEEKIYIIPSYLTMSLHSIFSTITYYSKIERNTYIYDYQLIKRGNKIEEKRILLEENGRKVYVKNAPLKTKRFYSIRPVFAPIQFLSRNWQKNYEYKIIKQERINGRQIIVIRALPKDKKNFKKINYGKVWIDKEDFSILKIEIEQESLIGFEKIPQKYLKPVFTVIHFYEAEKNGIRFPSKTVFKENYIMMKYGKKLIKKSETIISYDNYRFFTVKVEVEY